MSGALDTDDNLVTFGTALDPIEEEEVARKKPILISDQVATDERGRRRFHGAFTGGFSAGYFNTVGSKEGWTPSTFKSSRSERHAAQPKGQNVTDFMDEEDIGAFGIAPSVLRPTDDFIAADAITSTRKRPKAVQSDGPIPGVPVLHQIIEPVKETVGIKILVKMGWKPGQGVGPRIGRDKKQKSKRPQKKQKDKDMDDIEMPTIVDEEVEVVENQPKRTYGCQLPPELSKRTGSESGSDDDLDTDVLYAPEDVDSPLCNPKENTFGLGYKGLDRSSLVSSSGHVDLFGTQLKFRGDNQNSGVTGEAFGIGAFEEPDQDVYSREDLSQYDFELETMEEKRARKLKEIKDKAKKKKQSNECIDGFRPSESSGVRRKFFPAPHLPPNFEPLHSQRKSRFETAPPKLDDSSVKKGLGRHALTIQERQVLLGEELSGVKSPEKTSEVQPLTNADESQKEKEPDNHSRLPSDKDHSILERAERIKKFVQVLQAHSSSKPDDTGPAKPVFKPFLRNPEKQDRYEKYLTLVASGFQDCLKDLQPPEMTEWERDREKLEFERAADIYKPLSGVMSSRFVSAKSHDISHIVPEKEFVKEKDPTEDPKVAARLNLFGKLTHEVVEWHPDKLLCKRFNIKDPYPDSKFVGLRGGPSSKSESTGLKESQPVAAPAPIPPKKSLFDNLDFSKPPPGLPPIIPNSENGSEPQPPGTGEEILDFQTNATAIGDEKENIPVKPPLDLFKEIFADSSDSDDDDSPDEAFDAQENASRPALEKSDKGKDTRSKSKDRDDSNKDKGPSKDRLQSSSSGRTDVGLKERGRDNGEKTPRERDFGGKKGIFDDLDLTKLSRDRDNWNQRRNNTSTSNIERDEEEDDDDLLYGPRAPIPAKPLSTSSSNSKPQSTSQHSNPLSASSTSVSMKASLMNKDEVVWVEKDVVKKSRPKPKKHSIKKSKKSKKSSKSKKDKEKHKKSKKHKHKRSSSSGKLSKSRTGQLDSSASSSEDESSKIKDDESDSSSNDSSSSITIHGSLDQKALLAHLKKISRSSK